MSEAMATMNSLSGPDLPSDPRHQQGEQLKPSQAISWNYRAQGRLEGTET